MLRMFDGVIRTLRDVRFVLGLKKNLISLGQLDNSGLSYKAEGDILKVTKGAMVVIKAKRGNGLYKLQGETYLAKGDGGMSLVAKRDNTSLWHNKLGHMSLKGVQILGKQGLLEGDQITKLEQCESCILGKQHMLSFKLESYN